ncbi:MAG: hypothetical protein HY820_26500 [Acidobacteria bacterium]|nr:hypothetical protein [Acidobacteriota bacterium]
MMVEDRELSSWKEIASYLGVGVRTAQMWEQQRGLPVHRLPGPRGQVRALISELESWRSCDKTAPPLEPSPSATVLRTVPWWAWAGLALALTGAAGWLLPRNASPASYRIESTQLLILDGRGNELWRLGFDAPLVVWSSDGTVLTHVEIADLDGDGSPEVLVSGRTPTIRQEEQSLACYSARGNRLWSYQVTSPVRTKDHEFLPPFDVRAFTVKAADARGQRNVAVTSNHRGQYPSQLALLDAKGQVRSAAWHSGHLNAIAAQGNTLLVSGIRNATREATLLALDATRLAGAVVEENPDYQLVGMGQAATIARWTFPRTCLNRQLAVMNHAFRVDVSAKEIVVHVMEHMFANYGATLTYHFTPSLEYRGTEQGSGFMQENERIPKACRDSDRLVPTRIN